MSKAALTRVKDNSLSKLTVGQAATKSGLAIATE